MDCNPVPLKSIEKRCDCDPGGVDRNAALHFRYQPGAFDLGLPFGASERMPAALALAGLGITHVDDDGPVTGRAFADVAFHFSSLSTVGGGGPTGMSLTWRQSLASANSSSMRLAISG